MEKIITRPQCSDMGRGFGYYKLDGTTDLKTFLDWFKENEHSYGTFTILDGKDSIKEFDYDLYYGKGFNYNIEDCKLKKQVSEVTFSYCYMDITVFLKLKKEKPVYKIDLKNWSLED